MKQLIYILPVMFFFSCKVEKDIINEYACPGTPTVNYQGQIYNTVLIGNQCWLKENLNVGVMVNGTQQQTDNNIIEKYCYENDPLNCDIFGGLYQWGEIMNYENQQGSQGICPPNWHVPTDEEWFTLSTNLGCESVAGGKMKETSNLYWNSPNSQATNTSGFTALPGGGRGSNGSFGNLGTHCSFWSSNEISETHTWARSLHYENADLYRIQAIKIVGLSVRCIKNE